MVYSFAMGNGWSVFNLTARAPTPGPSLTSVSDLPSPSLIGPVSEMGGE